ncbi:MAG: hypothetical protein WCO56_00780 [Verrucomicrobiota bacterium]
MEHNLVEGTINTQAEAAINAAFATIRTNLPMLIRLTPTERKRLPHVTPASQGTLEQMSLFITNHPTSMSGDFDLAGFNADIALQEPWARIFAQVLALYEDMNDTNLALHADLYHSLLLGYAAAKVANRDGAYDAELALIKAFFARPRHAKAPATPTTPPTPPTT